MASIENNAPIDTSTSGFDENSKNDSAYLSCSASDTGAAVTRNTLSSSTAGVLNTDNVGPESTYLSCAVSDTGVAFKQITRSAPATSAVGAFRRFSNDVAPESTYLSCVASDTGRQIVEKISQSNGTMSTSLSHTGDSSKKSTQSKDTTSGTATGDDSKKRAQYADTRSNSGVVSDADKEKKELDERSASVQLLREQLQNLLGDFNETPGDIDTDCVAKAIQGQLTGAGVTEQQLRDQTPL